MEWHLLYGQNTVPTLEEIGQFVNSRLWEELADFIQSTYQVQPLLSYSSCSMQPGWNLKYKIGGRSLCTLYPMEGFFIALVVIGSRESSEAEGLLPSLSQYTQCLFHATPAANNCRWLMVHVTEAAILDDLIALIQVRKKLKRTKSTP